MARTKEERDRAAAFIANPTARRHGAFSDNETKFLEATAKERAASLIQSQNLKDVDKRYASMLMQEIAKQAGLLDAPAQQQHQERQPTTSLFGEDASGKLFE